MMRVWSLILFGALAVAAAACDEPEVLPPSQLNLDRPIAISFACYGPMPVQGTGEIVTSAQPPRWCDSYSPQIGPRLNEKGERLTPLPRPPGLASGAEPTFYWYGFVLQPASGTVALSRSVAKPSTEFSSGVSTNLGSDVQVRDSDPRTPGKNAISVGENPIAIATDVSGCHAVTANAGSCDLSALDINSAVAFDNKLSTPPLVNRLSVLNGAMQPIFAKPAAMVTQPSAPDVVVGEVCKANPAGMAYVAYPGCNLVAGVDLATGVVKSGIKFNGTVASVLTPAEIVGLTCVNECSGGAPSDVGAASTRPVSLDLRVDVAGKPTRLAIGADNSSVVTVVDLDAAFLPAAGAPLQIQLEDPSGKLGVTSVSLSPQIAMGNSPTYPRKNNNTTPADDGPPPGGFAQYVYAVASDGTVRVADVLTVRKECDTQIDLRFVRALASDPANIPRLQCFAVGDLTNPPRRSGARGPGIELPVDGPPTSVAILKGLDTPRVTYSMDVPSDNAPTPGQLIGYFAFITASSGQVFIVNVDDDDAPDVFVPSSADAPTSAQATQPVLLIAHQLRDSLSLRGAVAAEPVDRCIAADPPSASTGGPRASTAPVGVVTPDTLSNEPTESNKALSLPDVLRQACSDSDMTTTGDMKVRDRTVSELQLAADPALRDEVYPDLRATRSETWTLTWEGLLSNDTLLSYVDGPPIRAAQLRIDSQGIRLIDQSRPFCEIGVEPFDIVQLRGCNPVNLGNDCPSGYTCFVHENNPVNGLGACMLESEASRLSNACRDFLTSARRYTVGTAESGELTLLPRKHVLATTPVDGCVSDEQCSAAASEALALRSNKNPFELAGANRPVDPHTWQCAVDPLRAPLGGDPTRKRCIEICATTEQCELGSVCIGASGGTAKDGTCMESVLPSQSCVNGPQRFDVRASEAFTMIGLRSGYVHPVVEKGGTGADQHACVIPPVDPRGPGPVQVSRIPLTAPACNPAADKLTGALPGGGFDANPCSTTVTQVRDQPNYLSVDPASPDACVAATDPATVQVTRTDVPAIKVRNRSMTLTLADPYAPGDLVCAGDRLNTDPLLGGKIPQMVQAPFDSPTWFLPSFQLSFDQKGGYSPLTLSQLQVLPAFPVRVVRGPSESIWIMDAGDFLATQFGQSSTKGQVYRVEMSALTTVNLLQ